ncbi:MAG TPA: YihY/virulence factor BrkB family protein [Opitutaceae bacterium]|nr:YihY/virulence factor BrkB family protein [Opitutaceae bacterium]
MHSSLRIAGRAFKAWKSGHAFQHSAAVSFYTLFSLAPITVIALEITGLFFGEEVASRQLMAQVEQLVGAGTGELLREAVEASDKGPRGPVATSASVALLVFGATTVFGQLQESLNQLWGVRAKPRKHGWAILALRRLVSFAMVVTLAFLLMVSLILSTVLAMITERLSTGLAPLLAHAADFLIGLAVITLLFAGVFKVLPDVQLRWRDIWGGALMTALLFSVGRYGIAFYLGHSTVTSVYGAAGSLVALLVWVYYSCAILFYGAELIQAKRAEEGLPIEPKPSAVVVHEVVGAPGRGEDVPHGRRKAAKAKRAGVRQ